MVCGLSESVDATTLASVQVCGGRRWKGVEEGVDHGKKRGKSTAQRKCSTNVVKVASSEGLERLSFVMVSTEYITVEWCLAKSLPMSG